MDTSALLPLDNAFWRFSLRVYAVPEVAAECLDLQRVNAINVNMLLSCCWIAVSRHIALTAADIGSIEDQIKDWHALAVLPLRSIRDGIKSSSGMQDPQVQAFRRKILSCELDAERIEQALIFRQTERLSIGRSADATRDVMSGNIDLLRSLAPVIKQQEIPLPVSALIEASLAFVED